MLRSMIAGWLALCLVNTVLAAQPAVFATSYPLAYFAARIGGADIEVIVPDEFQDGTRWVPTIADIQSMQRSKLVLVSDRNREPWLGRVAIPTRRVVDTAAGFKDQLIRIAGATTHTHGPDGEHTHVASAANPWLDLSLAAAQARAIRDAMLRMKLGDATALDARLNKLEDELRVLDDNFQDLLKAAENAPVLAASDDYAYLARRYGLGLEIFDVHANPEQLLDKHPARWALWPKPIRSGPATRLAQFGVVNIVIDPATARPVDGDFLSVMQRNADALKQAIGD